MTSNHRSAQNLARVHHLKHIGTSSTAEVVTARGWHRRAAMLACHRILHDRWQQDASSPVSAPRRRQAMTMAAVSARPRCTLFKARGESLTPMRCSCVWAIASSGSVPRPKAKLNSLPLTAYHSRVQARTSCREDRRVLEGLRCQSGLHALQLSVAWL